nr:DEAD/DEAH box helicase family protein [uncultured Sulfurimonas sp.]
MESVNFEILRKDRPILADLGGFAEQYAHADPASALVKLRTLAEQLTKAIYWELRLEKAQGATFDELLRTKPFESAVPPVIRNKLHAARKEGNKAAHGGTVETQAALWIVQELFEASAWFAVRCLGQQPRDIAKFQQPKDQQAEAVTAVEEQKATEARLEEALAALEKVKADYEALAVEAETTAKSQMVADALQYDEATTRKRLIDVALAEAGWDINKPDQVTLEQKVEHQPNPTGIGYIDYVLWDDDGLPLAVIEAKKTSVSEEKGRKQAELYAEGLEKTYGFRPVIFYTNGYNTWIWDDAQGYPPRPLFGFYSKSSLHNLAKFQRSNKAQLDTFTPKAEIAGRIYQVETIKRVCENFSSKHRKALIVQATGTGKTRVAIALTDLLVRANWAKRILFLCDRKELVKQAKNAFNDNMSEPLTVVSRRSVNDNTSRIFVATYPAMQSIFQAFDVGFFDLVIADESHRSIYNRYRQIFQYFDALQVGLTATPVEFISRNTYGLFGCSNQDPTAFYALEDAVKDEWLVPYEVFTHTTKFLRDGIHYKDLTDEQKAQLEEDGEADEDLDHEANEVDNKVFNKDTGRHIIRNLMENGIRDASGQLPGKTIIFARRHTHAKILEKLFNELYPQYGGKFCQVIDNHDPRAEQLIDDFKGDGNNKDLTIAISVDMLDTGIDVPEVVNLVFAKPVKSKVKFWQMIGRGTRLCEDLFGPGLDKSVFRIFDHWANFEYFEQNKPEAEPSAPTSLMQRLFNARIDLAEAALNAPELDSFNNTVKLLEQDVNSLPADSIAVREKWQEVLTIQQQGVIERFDPMTVQALRAEISPLTQWINIRGQSDAYGFDLLMTQMQTALIQQTQAFEGLKGDLLNAVNRLRMNLNQVKAKAETIKQVKSGPFWAAVSLAQLENVRTELRSIMQYQDTSSAKPITPKVIDIEEDPDGIRTGQTTTGLISIDQAVYRKRVEEALSALFDKDPTLQKIRAGQPVSQTDLDRLISMVLTEHPDVDLNILREFYPDLADHLDLIIRNIIGMDVDAVRDRFQEFVHRNPSLSAKQTQFLRLLERLIAQNGSVEVEQLVDSPFTKLDQLGVFGLFPNDEQRQDLLNVVKTFKPQGNLNSSSDESTLQ